FLEKYFWDTDIKGLDKEKHAHFIIERILDRGDMDAIQWLSRNFKKSEMRKVLRITKDMTYFSANFWCLILRVSKKTYFAPAHAVSYK
ncbi:MAG: hypothetical protein G01um101433_360, partial [Parcubacteria group bacterium Gr01-1014_33]